MLEGLSFKTKNTFYEEKENQLTPQSSDINKKLLAQKEESGIEREKIKNKQERWRHIFDFAENYVTVFKSEIKGFYTKNPELYKLDCRKLKKETKTWLFSSIALLSLGVVGLPLLYSSGWVGKQIELFIILCSFGLTVTGVLGLISALVHHSIWKDKKDFGSKHPDFGPWEFMGMFEGDANLLDLWERKAKKRPDFDYDDMYAKKFKIKEKDLAKVNRYLETSRWAQQWSRGDLNNLHRVEWEALLGIVEKYEGFLTRIEKI